jgi:CRISPR-associated protein Cas1
VEGHEDQPERVHAAREHADQTASEQLTRTANILDNRIHATDSAADIDSLRGHEGEAAAAYFENFNDLLTHPDTSLRLKGRSRRPPLDPVNAVLSFLYTMLAHDCRSGCASVGLDPQIGFYHADRPGRAGLALDLMEELRPVLADRATLSLFNRRQLDAKSFKTFENGAVLLADDARKTVLQVWQERKQEEIVHPVLGEKIPLGLLPRVQAQLLARHLRGDLPAYLPYLWK